LEGKSNTACDEVESIREKWVKWRTRDFFDEREASLKNFAGSGPFGNCRKDLYRFPLSPEEAIAYEIDFLRPQCHYLLSVISRDFQNLTWCFTTFGLERRVLGQIPFARVTSSIRMILHARRSIYQILCNYTRIFEIR